MVELVPAGLAILAISLFVLALYAMAANRLTVAGMCFFSASIVIYFRETHRKDSG